MSLKTFNLLSKEDQKIFMNTAIECATYERNLLRDSEAKQIAEVKAKGMQVTTPNKKPFQDAAASVYKEFEGQFGKETIDKIIATK
jgi:TRAP-type C4-dicarboxylate transport system substrate-binding protein